ncbi:MAG: heavy metal translocating P-type ATPase [Hyphomicrobium sp.]
MAGAVTAEVYDSPGLVDPTPQYAKTIVLALENVHCGACIRAVESALTTLPSVASARVNLAQKRVTVALRTRTGVADPLIEALKNAGYLAAELTKDAAPSGMGRDTDLLRRLAVAGFASMNVMLLSVSVWSAADGDMSSSMKSLFHWISALIAMPTVAYSGQPFFQSARGAIRAGRLNMDVPISLGLILTTIVSVYQTGSGHGHVYFDAAVMLLAFLLLGRYLDELMRARATSAAANLLGLKSPSASVVSLSGEVERLPLAEVEPGSRVLVAAGERISVDGIVQIGVSDIDQSLITGESMPRCVKPGDNIFAGTINLGHPLTILSTRPEGKSLLTDIADLMLVAEQARGKYVRLADRAARLYAPAVHVLGLSTLLVWMWLGSGWEPSLLAAISVLIITCPCALALAVPAVQVAASSRMFSAGIILKAADGLERLNEVDTVVFDKTGTLTLGEPRLQGAGAFDRGDLLAAASLACASQHPYSRAIVAAARELGLTASAVDGVSELRGAGLIRETPEGEFRLGSASFCDAKSIEEVPATVWFKRPESAPVAMHFLDIVRADSANVVEALKGSGYHVELLSGDQPQTVARVAAELAIETWRAAQKPDEKIARLKELKAAGRRVLMVGDGLNDAPALAAAHASISPATAADISQTAADAVFQGSRLRPVLIALSVSKVAHRLAIQNFTLSIVYNVVFVPLAMVGVLTPLIAAIAMSLSSISVTANALRLKSARLELAS